MSSIEQGNQAIKKLQAEMNHRYYPNFHIAPPAGWMNDPNGLVYFNGQYHVFYQHHPYDENWGPMHWGHAVSDDLVNWTHLPIALAPGDEYDLSGCFSGSAIEHNGELCLLYTGHIWLGEPGDDFNLYQTQCLATSKDGIHFEKHGIVLEPEKGIMHFRDPKVWKQDGKFWMVLGQKDHNNVGQIRLYSSDDLRKWDFEQILIEDLHEDVYMLECPDFFELDGKWILMFSPQGFNSNRYQYLNRFQSGYIVGDWQPGKEFTIVKPFTEMDFGHDFYAPQSFVAKDGRRVVYAWMDMWESDMPSKKDKWMGSLTLPRQLRLDEQLKVRNRPVDEIKELRIQDSLKTLADVNLKNELMNTDIESQSCEIHLEIDLKGSTAERYGIQVAATKNGKQATIIYVDKQAHRIVLERSLSGLMLRGYRSVPLPEGDKVTLDIYVDKSSIEIFVNGDKYSLSSRIYPELPNELGVNLFAENGTAHFTKLEAWQLKAIFKTNQISDEF